MSAFRMSWPIKFNRSPRRIGCGLLHTEIRMTEKLFETAVSFASSAGMSAPEARDLVRSIFRGDITPHALPIVPSSVASLNRLSLLAEIKAALTATLPEAAADQPAPVASAAADPKLSATDRAAAIRAMAPDLPFLTSVLISSDASLADAAKAIGRFRAADKTARENMVALPEGGWQPNGQPAGTTIGATGGMGSSVET